MKVSVKAHANSKHPRIVVDEAGIFNVYVSAAATDGKANEAIIHALAEYFDVAPSLITITKGHTSKTKLINIPD